MIASLHSYSQTINIQSDEPENGKCKFSVSSKLIDMYKLTCILYNYVLGKKHILHGRYADLTFLFKIMDFLLKKTLIDTVHAQLYQ